MPHANLRPGEYIDGPLADKSALRQYIVRLRGIPMVLGKLQYRLWFSPNAVNPNILMAEVIHYSGPMGYHRKREITHHRIIMQFPTLECWDLHSA